MTRESKGGLQVLKIKAVVFCAATAIVAVSFPALANTIFLKCPSANNTDAETLTVDLTKKTVNNYAARINATSIHWEHNLVCGAECTPSNPGTAVQIYDLDRTTGSLSIHDEWRYLSGVNESNSIHNFTCAVGNAPATKF
jgi:hypothetical protein